jgi:hypothetical protein
MTHGDQPPSHRVTTTTHNTQSALDDFTLRADVKTKQPRVRPSTPDETSTACTGHLKCAKAHRALSKLALPICRFDSATRFPYLDGAWKNALVIPPLERRDKLGPILDEWVWDDGIRARTLIL